MSIDISKIPAPQIVEDLSIDALLEEMLTELQARMPSAELHPADPAYKVLEVAAYFRFLDRQKANERTLSVFLAYATASELDHIGITYYGVERQETEADDDYRRRLLLSYDSYSTAGSKNSYIYHTLSASPTIKDATATSRAASEVLVTVLSSSGNGTATQQQLDTVSAALNAETVRPLNDQVTVQSASVQNYTVTATLTLRNGPSPEVVKASALAAVQDLTSRRHRLGESIIRGAIEAALYVEGVQRVQLSSPANDILRNESQAAYCSGITINIVSAAQ